MEAFLIITLVFVSLVTLMDLLICLNFDGQEGYMTSFGVALLNLFPLIMTIIAISLAL